MASVASAVLSAYPAGIINQVGALQLNGTLSFTAGTYTAGGLPLSFAGLAAGINPNLGPASCQIASRSSGYQYVYDLTNKTVRIFEGGAAVSDPLAELGSGSTLPSGVTGDAPQFTATVIKG